MKSAYASFPQPARDGLLALRDLIFDLAADLPVGDVDESLKWGQPSYTTTGEKSGTPVRLSLTKQGDIAILTHCQSTVIGDFRAICDPSLTFDGNRALHLDPSAPIPTAEITPLIRAALTYRL